MKRRTVGMGLQEKLARSAACGDREAFSALVRTTAPVLERYLWGLLREPDLVEEATQETWARVVRSLRAFRGEAAFTTWLISIAKRVVADLLHKRRHTPTPVGVAPEEIFGMRHPCQKIPEQAIEVFRALENLPRELREVLVLTRILGCSYRETAAIVGTNEGTVKSRVFRARKLLVDAVGKFDETAVGGRSDAVCAGGPGGAENDVRRSASDYHGS